MSKQGDTDNNIPRARGGSRGDGRPRGSQTRRIFMSREGTFRVATPSSYSIGTSVSSTNNSAASPSPARELFPNGGSRDTSQPLFTPRATHPPATELFPNGTSSRNTGQPSAAAAPIMSPVSNLRNHTTLNFNDPAFNPRPVSSAPRISTAPSITPALSNALRHVSSLQSATVSNISRPDGTPLYYGPDGRLTALVNIRSEQLETEHAQSSHALSSPSASNKSPRQAGKVESSSSKTNPSSIPNAGAKAAVTTAANTVPNFA